MGTVHTDNPLNDLQDLEINDVEFHGFNDDEGDSNNDFYDALDTLDEEYPFQSLAPPSTSRSYLPRSREGIVRIDCSTWLRPSHQMLVARNI